MGKKIGNHWIRTWKDTGKRDLFALDMTIILIFEAQLSNDLCLLRSYNTEISGIHPEVHPSDHVCSSLPLQQQHCWLYHRGILQSGLYVLIAFFKRLWTSPLPIMSFFKEMRFGFTVQRECEGHTENTEYQMFYLVILNRQKEFQILKVCYVTPTFFPWYNLIENVLFLYYFYFKCRTMLLISSYISCTLKCIGSCVTLGLVQQHHLQCEAIKPSRVKLEIPVILSTHWNPSFYHVSSGCGCEEVSVCKKLWHLICMPSTLPLLLHPISWFCFPVTPYSLAL